MHTIRGKYAEAVVFTDLIEDEASVQIRALCDQPFVKGCRIRIMPDVHAGSGCVIGFTADLGELVIPNIVGVDIGCGMLTLELGKREPDYALLDQTIRAQIPAGFDTHDEPVAQFGRLDDLLCLPQLNDLPRIRCSIGTLGGGNHFIEVDRDDEGNYYLVIHTGSRNLGKQVAEYYQQLAIDTLGGKIYRSEKRREIIESYKAAGREKELSQALAQLREELSDADLPPKELCCLKGAERDAYLHDMEICQAYAVLNRRTIAARILEKAFGMQACDVPSFETIHNYIDHKTNIIRKGAVSAQKGEKLLIPINMRDGSLICIGKGAAEWNCSAPHGAGRLVSRKKARELFSVADYEAQMRSVYTTSVCAETLDECPMAYKPIESILGSISPTADVLRQIRPVYNFKAAD